MIGVSKRSKFTIDVGTSAQSTEECGEVGPDSYVLHESRSSIPDAGAVYTARGRY